MSSKRSRSQDADDKLESIPLISNSHRSSGRERRTTQKYKSEHVSPRSRSSRRSRSSSRSSSRSRSSRRSSSRRSSSRSEVKQGSLNISDTNNMALSSSHVEKETTDEKYNMVFTIGRMNPPTSGHLKLIFELMRLARENNLDNIGIVLSSSEDIKNPLSCYRKKQYISEMVSSISDIKTNIICKEKNTGFPMSNIYELLHVSGVDNNSKMLLIIGKDRDNGFNWLKKYYPNMEIRALDRPEGAMSGTKIRGYVSAKNKNEFDRAYADILDQNTIDDLYNEIASGLSKYSTTAPASSKKSKKRGGRKPRQTRRQTKRKRISTRY